MGQDLYIDHIDGVDISNPDDSNEAQIGYITGKEQSSVSTPASGYGSAYFKTDGKFYIKDDAGTETNITDAGVVAPTQKSANYTVTTSDRNLEGTTNSFTFTLYGLSGNEGRRLTFSNTGTGVVTITRDGSDTFRDGSTSKYLSTGQSMTIYASDEWIVESYTKLVGIVEDQKSSGSNGGGATANTVQTRTLNATSGDFTNFGSLASNQMTLDPGTYRMKAGAPVNAVDRHQVFIYDATGTSYLQDGQVAMEPNSGTNAGLGWVEAEFSITTASAIEIRQWFDTTQATNGLGIAVDNDASNPQSNEIFTRVYIEKLV